MSISLENPIPLRPWRELPGPRGLPLIGLLGQIRLATLHQQLEAWVGRYGEVYPIRIGPKPVLVVAKPELITAALRDRPDGWRRPASMADVIAEMGATGLFSAEGEDWRRQRRLVMGAFDPAHLKDYFPSLQQVTERLRARLAAGVGQTQDLQQLLMRYTVDVTSGLAFGADINTLDVPSDKVLQQHLDKVFPMLMRRLNIPFPYWRHFKLPADRAFDHHLAAVKSAVWDLIGQARERVRAEPLRLQNPANLLEALLAARDEHHQPLSDGQLYGNVLTILLAGEDTTANTLAWALHHLHQRPDCWAALRAELDAALGDAPMLGSFEQARELPYLEACINETMRLRPVAPLLFAEAQQAVQLGGLAIEPDDIVICLMRPGATDTRLQSDAADFNPRRWLVGDAHDPSAAGHGLLKASMPFGAGPRLCPGRYLALLEMKMVLAMLARNFDLQEVACADGREPQECLAFTMYPVGLHLRVSHRKH